MANEQHLVRRLQQGDRRAFEEFLDLEKEVSTLEEKLETRKAVDRAKGILMDLYGLKEQDAFRRIQVQSMNTRKSMREIAEAIIIANSV